MRQHNAPSLATVSNFADATPRWKSPDSDKACHDLLHCCHHVLVDRLFWIDDLDGRFGMGAPCRGKNWFWRWLAPCQSLVRAPKADLWQEIIFFDVDMTLERVVSEHE